MSLLGQLAHVYDMICQVCVLTQVYVHEDSAFVLVIISVSEVFLLGI